VVNLSSSTLESALSWSGISKLKFGVYLSSIFYFLKLKRSIFKFKRGLFKLKLCIFKFKRGLFKLKLCIFKLYM